MYTRLAIILCTFALSLLPAARASAEQTCSTGPKGWVPPGSVLLYRTANEQAFRVPAGYSVALFEGGFSLDAKQRCTCTQGSGCSPVFAGGKQGCAQDGCSSCTGTRNGVAVDLGGIYYATMSEAQENPHATGEVFQIEFIREELEQFVRAENGGQLPPPAEPTASGAIAPKGYVFALVNVYGYLVNVLIPHARAIELGLPALGATLSCSCNAGSGCTAKKAGPARWCEAGSCSDCLGELSNSFSTIPFGF